MGKPQARLKWDELPVAPVAPPARRRAWRPRSRHQACLAALVGALLVAAGWVCLQAAITTTGHQLARARIDLSRATRTGEELRLELAVLRSVERVEAIATERLGFSRPPEIRVVAAPAAGAAPAAPAPTRTVTLTFEDGGAGGVAVLEPVRTQAWDQFLRWLAGRAAEAGSRY